LTGPNYAADADVARTIAAEAGALLLALQQGGGLPGELGTQGDREANALIIARLKAAFPNDFILSEEAPDDTTRCSASRVWIVDPLDGTREYAAGRNDWAVHIGLAVDGAPVAGAVAVPGAGRIFTSNDAAGMPAATAPHGPRMLVSRSRPPEIAIAAASAIGATLVPMGSAGAKAMAVVTGEAEIYLHDGGQYEWDSCAPVAVALAAGCHASRIDGTPLVYNGANPYLPDLLICRPEWAARVLSAIAAAHQAKNTR
jgi:3'(2'), 5'-bisphosphate nucleotidase